jgi:RES domain
MTRRVACPPPPPVGQPATLHFHTLTPDDTLYRIYRGADAAQFCITTGNNRFDPLPSPWNATKVLYAGSSKEVAISETVLRWHDRVGDGAKIILARSQLAGRQLVGLRWNHPLRLLDFTGFGMKALTELVGDARGEDIFLSDASQYSLTQKWGAWFRSAYPDAVGLRWMSRQHNSSSCYVFFDDTRDGQELKVAEAAEPLEAGTHAFQLLEECINALSWEIES